MQRWGHRVITYTCLQVIPWPHWFEIIFIYDLMIFAICFELTYRGVLKVMYVEINFIEVSLSFVVTN